jgi:hypothetical protein
LYQLVVTGTNGTNYATITVNVPTGGSGNYTIYDFKKLACTKRVKQTPIPNRIYQEVAIPINVYDDKGCSGITTAVINPL